MNVMYLDYKILESDSASDLEDEVRVHFKEGWELYGNLVVTVMESKTNLSQAEGGQMTKAQVIVYSQAITKR